MSVKKERPQNKHLKPTDPNTPEGQEQIRKMQAGLKRYHEEQKLKKETAAQAKARTEAAIQTLALEDVTTAIANGELSGDSINVVLQLTKTLEQLGNPADLDKDGKELWKFCMKQLQAATGQEAAKKSEEVVDLRDTSNMTREELNRKAAAMRDKFGVEVTVGDNNEEKGPARTRH